MKNFSMLIATMALTASICGMAKPPAVKMATLEQLTHGEVSLWRFMLDRQLVTYGDRTAEVMAKITGLDSEAMKVVSQISVAVVLSSFDNESELAMMKVPNSASDAYDTASIVAQKFNASFTESKAKIDIDNILVEHPEIDRILAAFEFTTELRQLVDNFFQQYEEVPSKVIGENISSKLASNSTEVEPRLIKVLVDFLVAPSKQKLLFRAYLDDKLSESELTAELLQLIEKDAEMGVFSTAELEELRQALQLEEYPAGIFFSKEE